MRILGISDWDVIARDANGSLLYVDVEYDPHWASAPSGGVHAPGTPEWRRDNAWMLDYVTRHQESYIWSELIGGWPPEDDEGFMRANRRNELPLCRGEE